MREPVAAYVGIGANLGDAKLAVQGATRQLGLLPATQLVRASSLYRTAPHDSSGPDYVNAVALLATQLDAHALLAHLQRIENAAGRERPFPNAPRTLDLDLLLYGDEHILTPELIVPHPRMQGRAFVLVPLAEIAPALVTRAQLDAVAGQPIERVSLPPT